MRLRQDNVWMNVFDVSQTRPYIPKIYDISVLGAGNYYTCSCIIIIHLASPAG